MERVYEGGGLRLRIRGLGSAKPIRVHLEHDSGAALIVPGCDEDASDLGPRLETVGFDGTIFTIDLDEASNDALISASAPTPILGGSTEARIARGPDAEYEVRVTGDEETMPIQVK